jgi:hypothetical protein
MEKQMRRLAMIAWVVLLGPADAAGQSKIGVWTVRSDTDPMNDQPPRVSVRTQNEEDGLVFRCFGNQLSVVLSAPGRLNARNMDAMPVRYRIDRDQIDEMRGEPFGPMDIDIRYPERLMYAVQQGTKIVFEFGLVDGSVRQSTFSLVGAQEAIEAVRWCGLSR